MENLTYKQLSKVWELAITLQAISIELGSQSKKLRTYYTDMFLKLQKSIDAFRQIAYLFFH